ELQRTSHHAHDGAWCDRGPSELIELTSILAHSPTLRRWIRQRAPFESNEPRRALEGIADARCFMMRAHLYAEKLALHVDRNDEMYRAAVSLHSRCEHDGGHRLAT